MKESVDEWGQSEETMTTDPKQQGGPRDVCERCQRPQFSDIQDAVSHHFDRAFCADIKGSPAGQCECRDHTIEQLRRQIARHSVCVVCRCDLILSSEAPHCFDCVPTDEQRDEWEAAGPVGESPPIDPRPLCIRCGQRWVPNEGVDATVTACCETMEEPTSRPTGPGDDTLEGWELSFHNGAPIAFRDDESVILKHDHALDIETCGPALRLPLPVLRHLGVDLAAGRASLEGEVKALRDETWYLGTALEESQQALASAAARVKEIETDLEKHRSIMSAQTETISELEAERQDAVDESFALADTIADSNKQLAALQSLTQVALEAVRLIWHDNGDRCGECGLIGAGELKSALLKLLGPEPWKLIWGNDANIDREAWDKALAASGVGKEST